MAQTIDLIKNTSFETKMDNLISAVGSGTSSYTYLADKPSINGNTLEGNKTNSQLGISSASYKTISVGATDVNATTVDDDLSIIAGTNMTITPDSVNKTITFASVGGSGTGDMLKSEFATNGTTGIVDNSNRLRKYTTTNSGTTYTNQWTKVATVTFTAGYQSSNTIFSVTNGGDLQRSGIFCIHTRVGSTINTSTVASLYCISCDKDFKTIVGNLKLVYTAPTYELWFNPSLTYQLLGITILQEFGSQYITWIENQPYQATQPTGTVVTATLMENYLITDLTAETTIVDTDYFMMHDTSAVANRKTLWSAIKSTLKTYFDPIYTYTLPTASPTVKGGVKIGSGLTMTGEVLSSNGGVVQWSTLS